MINFWNIIELLIIIILIVIMIFLILNSQKQRRNNNVTFNAFKEERNNKAELARRQKEANALRKRIEKEIAFNKNLLSKFIKGINERFKDCSKTETDFTNKNNPGLHAQLRDLFENLKIKDRVIYCKRCGWLFCSDDYFIITERGIGLSVGKKSTEIIPFYLFQEVIYNDEEIEFRNIDDEKLEILREQFVYSYDDCDYLIDLINNFIQNYTEPLDTYLSAGKEAVQKILTPILEEIIQKIGECENAEEWKLLLKAYYKFLLARDGEDVRHNKREAIEHITDAQNLIKKSIKENEELPGFYYECELLRARLMLLDEQEDQMAVKKIIDTVAYEAKDADVRDEAAAIKRELQL